jgi:hypothetical protein
MQNVSREERDTEAKRDLLLAFTRGVFLRKVGEEILREFKF